MMKVILFFAFIFLFHSFDSRGQTGERISVRAGEDLSKYISSNGAYRFRDFDKGTIIFKDAKKVTAALNYNVLSSAMDFIGDKGDTLSIGNSEGILTVLIGKTLYYYQKGYMEVIGETAGLKLAMMKKFTIESEKLGAYGVEAPTSSIADYQNYYTSTGNYGLTLNQNIVLTKEISFFWVDEKNRILAANENQTLAVYARDKQASIRDFIHKKRINFRRQEDLFKLMDFLKLVN